MTSFEQEFDKEVTAAIQGEELRGLLVGTRVAYEFIWDNWPRSTYYSVSNHRILIGGGVAAVFPKAQPTRKAAMVAESMTVRKMELAKLKKINKNRVPKSIRISNRVHYAATVNRGLYEQAASFANTQITQDARQKSRQAR